MCAEIDFPNRRGGDRDQYQGGGDEGNPELTSMAPPLWTTAAGEGEEDAELRVEDTAMGYHPIRDETPSIGAAVGGESHDDDDNSAGNGVANGHGSGSNGVSISNGQSTQGRIVTVNGLEFHVYGNASGLELLSLSDRQESLHVPDSDEEEEEERRRVEAEQAILEANRAHEARRAAPIPPEHRARILNAMKAIDLGGFRPAWADSVPEDQWIQKITADRGNSGS